jgi:receptor expression-enhancing protein 5/6
VSVIYISHADTWQYWVVYAFLTVVESAINAVYWFPFYYVFKFVLVLWMALPQTS